VTPDDPWPDQPVIPEYVPRDLEELGWDAPRRPTRRDIDDQNTLLLRRQRLFRWAAQMTAWTFRQAPEVQKVVAFGSVAGPLKKEVPRFRDFRRFGIEVVHECQDLDLAVWVTDLDRLQQVKKAMNGGLSLMQETPYGGVASHQVDVHIFDAATDLYRGRLCHFKECPKPHKRECDVPRCGARLFLRQFAGYRFNQARFESEPKVLLFDRATGFVVPLPQFLPGYRLVEKDERTGQ